MAGRFDHTGVGDKLRFAGRDWTVVCRFSAGGSAFESEIWGENEQFMPVFRGEGFQSVTFRLKDAAAFEEAKRTLEARQAAHGGRAPRVRLLRQAVAAAGQRSSELLAILITSIMAVGAIFGAINTMYAAVSAAEPGDRGAAHARLPPAERAGQLPRRVRVDRAGRGG